MVIDYSHLFGTRTVSRLVNTISFNRSEVLSLAAAICMGKLPSSSTHSVNTYGQPFDFARLITLKSWYACMYVCINVVHSDLLHRLAHSIANDVEHLHRLAVLCYVQHI